MRQLINKNIWRNSAIRTILAIMLLSVASPSMAQVDTVIVQENISFAVKDKPMWGKDSEFTINKHFDLIPKKEFNVSLPFPPPKISLLGGDFGFDLEASLYMSFGLGFYFKDFTAGSIDIDFPIDIEFDVPAFNSGDFAVIKTGFVVRDEAKITTYYPSAGRIGMTTDIALKSRLAFGVCFYECLSPFSLFGAVPLPDGLNSINPIKDGALVIDTTDPESLFSMPLDTLFQISQKEGESFSIGLNRKPLLGETGLGTPEFLCSCDPNDNGPGIPTIEKNHFDLLPFTLNDDVPSPLDCEAINDRREADSVQRANDNMQEENDKKEEEDDKTQAEEDDKNYDNASDDEKKEIDKRREEREERKKKRKKNAYDRATRFLRALDALTGSLNIPHVKTSRPLSNLGNRSMLVAKGDSTYVDAIFSVGKALRPVPYVGLLNAKIIPPEPIDCLGSLEYSIFDIEAKFNITNEQEFSFYPTVMVKIDFPEPLDYAVVDPNGGIAANKSTSVIFEAGSELNVKFPCNYDFLELKPTYSIQKGSANFRNHTYDTYGIGLAFKALSFKLQLNSVVLLPKICIPEICIPFIGCTPEFCTPQIKSPSYNLDLGPVLDEDVPIASPSVDWFNQEWEIDGFEDVIGEPFKIAPVKFKLDLLAQDVSCAGSSTGSVALTKQGGTGNISYSWSNGATTADLTDVPAGLYFLTAIDQNGCPAYASVQIKEPEALTAIETTSHVGCFGENNGAISLDVRGGEAPYLYFWSNGAVTKDVDNLVAGEYTVEITDAAGCTVTKYIQLEESLPMVTGIAQITEPGCAEEASGEIKLSVSGGTAPFTYEWSHGWTERDASGLAAGTYSVTITDNNGCVQFHEVTLESPAILEATVQVVRENLCFDEENGALNLTVNGGVGPYEYRWYRNNVEISTTEEDPENLLAGEYWVVIRDAGGCEISATATIGQPEERLISNIFTTDVSCYGGSDGQITLSVDGGANNYTYNWSNGQTSKNLENVPAGVYTVTITDTNGCSSENAAIIYEPKELTIDYFVTDIRCEGDESGSIEVFAYGGNDPYTYEWLNGETSPRIKDLGPGSYQVVVTDALGCAAMASMEINTDDEPCVTIPNAFTPNGDGTNDEWIIRNMDLTSIRIKIFNKWGQQVYSSTGYSSPWNGSYNGKILPSGTYYYVLDPGDGTPVINGSISIVK